MGIACYVQQIVQRQNQWFVIKQQREIERRTKRNWNFYKEIEMRERTFFFPLLIILPLNYWEAKIAIANLYLSSNWTKKGIGLFPTLLFKFVWGGYFGLEAEGRGGDFL